LSLIPGELFGLLLVAVKGTVLKRDAKRGGYEMKAVMKTTFLLWLSELLSAVIFNSDRIMIKLIVGSTAVTVFYLSSLIGKTVALVTGPFGSVIMGYISRYRGGFGKKTMRIIFICAAAIILPVTAVCTLGSHIFVKLFYADSYEAIKSYFFIANLSQVMFFVSDLIVVVLIRFAKSTFPLIINATYAVFFCGLCIPLSVAYSVWGFCVGLLIACTARFLTAAILGFRCSK
jgi:O-antigen/teichoic acid export membrane protein